VFNKSPDEMVDEEEDKEKMIQVRIIHNNGQIMTVGYGNSKEQAERNASINGLQWLQNNRLEDIKELLKNS